MIETDLPSMITRLPAVVYSYAVNHETGESSFPYLSDYCEDMFGFPASAIKEDPKMFVNCIHEEEVENFSAQVMESMTNLTPFDRLGRMRHANGRIIHVHGKSMPRVVDQINEDGTSTKLTVWDGVLFDVTKQVCNQEKSRTKLQEMIDNTLQPVFAIDTKGNILEWNDAMAKVTEYTKEQVLGQPVVGFMPEEERGKFAAFCSRAVESSQPADSEEKQEQQDCIFITKDGQKQVFLHAKCTASMDANGRGSGLLFCCQDLTMVKEAQKQKDAALKLVDAERGLTEWLSHEVRNPLSVAMEAAVALQEGDNQGDENLSYSDLICESIRYIVDLLTNMLDLNKCLDGKIALFPSTCRVREEVLVPTCKIMGVRNNLVKLVLGDCDEVVASVDKLRLRQVITNLVANALKYTTEGFVRVDLQEIVRSHHKAFRIAVSDSGCGIDPSGYKMLFSKWEQLGSQINGTGIGLCLSKSLVRAMGGELSINKEYKSGFKENQGAQFIVEIPLSTMLTTDAEEDRMPAFEHLSAAVLGVKRRITCTREDSCISCESATSESKKARVSSGRKSEICLRGKFHILIVDDDVMGRRLLRRRFARLFPDAKIDEVESGEAALREAEKTTFDLITVDHYMAVDDMDGEETIRALRARKDDSCIVGISGNSKREEHLAAGAQDFFQKPIPKDKVFVDRLVTIMSPPGGWKVLCVDDVEVNIRFLCRRLRKISAPYFTSMEEAEKRWDITSRSTGEEAMELLKKERFDLIILDQHLGDGVTGTAVASFARENGLNNDAVIVLNSGSMLRPSSKPDLVPFNVHWPKPLPATEKMRLDLCRELLDSKNGKAHNSFQQRNGRAA